MSKKKANKSIKTIIRELGESSALHGLPKIVSNRQTIRILWCCLFLMTTVFLGIESFNLLTEYYSYPTTTTIGIAFSALKFPSISFCNLNPIRKSMVEKLTSPELRDLLRGDSEVNEEKITEMEETVATTEDTMMPLRRKKRSDSCFTNSAVWSGTQSTTLSGRTCQRWDSQSPHMHSRNNPSLFPDANLAAAENYCRDPDGEGAPWCFTTDPFVEREFCGVKPCAVPDDTLADAANYCRDPDASGVPWCYHVDQYKRAACPVPLCTNDPCFTNSAVWSGTQSTTVSGLTCQRWDSQSPHWHNRDNPALFPDATLAEAANYCRDPDGKGAPWCFTTFLLVEWEFCGVKPCAVPGDCYIYSANYVGTQSITVFDRECQRWDSQFPNFHDNNNPNLFPDNTIADAANYCRDPDASGVPWCYHADQLTRVACPVPMCTNVLTTTTTTATTATATSISATIPSSPASTNGGVITSTVPLTPTSAGGDQVSSTEASSPASANAVGSTVPSTSGGQVNPVVPSSIAITGGGQVSATVRSSQASNGGGQVNSTVPFSPVSTSGDFVSSTVPSSPDLSSSSQVSSSFPALTTHTVSTTISPSNEGLASSTHSSLTSTASTSGEQAHSVLSDATSTVPAGGVHTSSTTSSLTSKMYSSTSTSSVETYLTKAVSTEAESETSGTQGREEVQNQACAEPVGWCLDSVNCPEISAEDCAICFDYTPPIEMQKIINAYCNSKADEQQRKADYAKNLLKAENSAVRQDAGHQLNDFVITASFAGIIQDKMDPTLFHRTSTVEYGNCFTLSSDVFVAWTSGQGQSKYLTWGMSEADEYIGGMAQGYGLRLLFHNDGAYPNPSEEGVTISSGFDTIVGLRKVYITRLQAPYGDCIAESDMTFEKKYGIKYSMSVCIQTCLTLQTFDTCGCLLPNAPDVDLGLTNTRLCNFTSLKGNPNATQDNTECKWPFNFRYRYHFCALGVQGKYDSKDPACHCSPPCRQSLYEKTISGRIWPTDDYLVEIVRMLCENGTSNTVCDDFRNNKLLENKERHLKNFLQVTVYYEDLNYQSITQEPAYTGIQFISDVGGVLGLFLGASVLTFAELLHLAVEIAIHFFNKRRGKFNGPLTTKVAPVPNDDKTVERRKDGFSMHDYPNIISG